MSIIQKRTKLPVYLTLYNSYLDNAQLHKQFKWWELFHRFIYLQSDSTSSTSSDYPTINYQKLWLEGGG